MLSYGCPASLVDHWFITGPLCREIRVGPWLSKVWPMREDVTYVTSSLIGQPVFSLTYLCREGQQCRMLSWDSIMSYQWLFARLWYRHCIESTMKIPKSCSKKYFPYCERHLCCETTQFNCHLMQVSLYFSKIFNPWHVRYCCYPPCKPKIYADQWSEFISQWLAEISPGCGVTIFRNSG